MSAFTQFFTRSHLEDFKLLSFNIYSKILLIIGFCLIIYNLFVLYSHQPQGYVINIYSQLPPSFYIGAILCYLFSSFIIIWGTGSIRKFGIFLLILNHATILLIPFMLGYFSMGRADDMTYIGEYAHIGMSGYISVWDIYPGSLIIGAILSILSAIPANIVSFIIPIVFSFLFIVGLYLCFRFFFLRDTVILSIAIISSFILYLGPYNFLNVPHALFFAYVPIFIFILSRYIQKRTLENTILLIFPILLIPYTHPFIVFFVVFLLGILIITNKALKKIINAEYSKVKSIFLILLFSFLIWFFYASSLLTKFRGYYHQYSLGLNEPIFFRTTEKLYKIHADFTTLIQLLFVYYARYSIPIIIIIIMLILALLGYLHISGILKKDLLFFGVFLVFFLLIEGILFFNPLIIHQPDRMTNLNFIVFAQVPLFVIALFILYKNWKFSLKTAFIVVAVVTCIWGLSFFGSFESPNIFKPNSALTYNEVEGMTWFYQNRNNENLMVPISQIFRFHMLFADGKTDNDIPIRDHFGYEEEGKNFGEINLGTKKDGYLIIFTYDELLYQKVPGFIEVGRYNVNDFIRLQNDPTVNKIYNNTNIEVYYIN